MQQPGVDEQPQTQFNVAIACLIRLHQLLELCNLYSRYSYYQGPNLHYLKEWRLTVDAVHREIGPKMIKEEQDKIKRIKKRFSKVGKVVRFYGSPAERVSRINSSNFRKNWLIVGEIESYLRKLSDEKGMLIPNKAGVRDAIADME